MEEIGGLSSQFLEESRRSDRLRRLRPDKLVTDSDLAMSELDSDFDSDVEAILARQPRVVVTRLSDSDTDGSMMSVSSGPASGGDRQMRKRTAPVVEGAVSGTDVVLVDETSSPKVTKSTKGRGRPATTGQFVGLAKAQQELNAARREQFLLDAAA